MVFRVGLVITHVHWKLYYTKSFLIEQKKLSTPNQYTWLAKLMAYDYKIWYKHRKLNVVADTLSRINALEVNLQAVSKYNY